MTNKSRGKAKNPWCKICSVSVVPSHWRKLGLNLVWGTFAFLKQMHTISSPQQAHLCPRLTVWWLCQVFGMIRSEGGASWGKNFIKEDLNTICFNIFKMVSLLLLSFVFPCTDCRASGKVDQEHYCQRRTLMGKLRHRLTGVCSTLEAGVRAGKILQRLSPLWVAIAKISSVFLPWHTSKWSPHSKAGLISQNKCRYPQWSL